MNAKQICKNDRFCVKITEINNLGCGVGHLEGDTGQAGLVAFVKGAVPGETVEALAIKVTRSYLVGKLLTVLVPSLVREQEDLCASPMGCGGCVYRSVSYEYEKESKHAFVRNAFRKAGLPDVTVLPVLSTGKLRGYRNKAEYPVAEGKNGIEVGFYASKSHRLVPASDCALQPPEFAEITSFLCSYLNRLPGRPVTAYREETRRGLLRHIYLRRGEETGEVLVTLVVTSDRFPQVHELGEALMRRFPYVVGVLLNINPKATNVVLGDVYLPVCGKDTLTDRLLGLTFTVAPAAFWQVNHGATELLYTVAREKAALRGNETLLDLYCGIGSIGLCMAREVEELIGIEIVPEAVACAKENAEQNGIRNASFYCGDASSAEAFLAQAEDERGEPIRADIAVLDPPRKGTTETLMDVIAKRKIPRVLYISCNPDTLARDCAYFRKLGYSIGDVQPVDLFPRTAHVECVVLMSRIEK